MFITHGNVLIFFTSLRFSETTCPCKKLMKKVSFNKCIKSQVVHGHFDIFLNLQGSYTSKSGFFGKV